MDLFRSSPSFFIASESPQTETRFPNFQERTTLNQLTTLRWSLKKSLEKYAEAKLPAIGVSWRKLREAGLQRGVRRIQKSGMQVSSLGWVGGFTGANQHDYHESIRECRNAIKVAAQINAASLTVLSGPDGGHIRSNAMRCVSDALKEIGDLALVHGVTLAFQPMHVTYKKNWSFIHTLDDTLKLLDEVNRSSVKLALGTYHLWQEENLLQRIPTLVPRIASVQLSDWHRNPKDDNDRCIPGQGLIPINAIVEMLEKSGYAGWYEFEIWSRELWQKSHNSTLQSCLKSTISISESIDAMQLIQ